MMLTNKLVNKCTMKNKEQKLVELIFVSKRDSNPLRGLSLLLPSTTPSQPYNFLISNLLVTVACQTHSK